MRLVPFLLLGLLVGLHSVSAAELAYHFQDGESWNYRVENLVKIPTQGDVTSTVDYAFTATDGDPIHLEADISGTSNRYVIEGSHAAFDLTSYGQASNLQSDNLDHPIDGGLVKNAPNFFFPLPDGQLSPGETWQVQATFHFPKLEIQGAFTSLRTISTYRYQGSQELDDGRVVELLEISTVEAPGQKQKVVFQGQAHFDASAGRMTKVDIGGYVQVKVGFLKVKVPVTLKLSETAPALS